MLSSAFIGKQFSSLPAEAQRAILVAVAEIDNPRDIPERLDRVRQAMTRSGNGSYLIVALRVRS